MFKKIAVVAVLGVACLWVAKKTQLCSYASTLLANGKEHLRGQIPRDLELARVQHEIQQLDRDYQGLLGPIAEKMAAIKKLDREIATAKANQEERRVELLVLTKAVDTNQSLITCGGANYNLDQAKVKLARDFATFKKLDAHLVTREKLLEAENRNLAATREQLDKLISQKRDFEIRLAQLEAEEATLKAARIQTPLQTDDGRVADIKRTLERIEMDQNVEQNRHVLQQQYGPRIGDAQPTVQTGTLDVGEIRNYLNGKSDQPTKVAQSK